MNIYIDTTEREIVVVRLLDEKEKVDEIVVNQQKGSQVLLPSIVEILKRNKKTINDIKGVEVETGPGSFTGTRIGVTVANTLGYILNIPVNGKLGKIVLPKYEKSKFDE